MTGGAQALAEGGAEPPRRAAAPIFAALVMLLSHETAAVRVRAAACVKEVSCARGEYP